MWRLRPCRESVVPLQQDGDDSENWAQTLHASARHTSARRTLHVARGTTHVARLGSEITAAGLDRVIAVLHLDVDRVVPAALDAIRAVVQDVGRAELIEDGLKG